MNLEKGKIEKIDLNNPPDNLTDADKNIIYKLKQEGKLYKKETIVHTYPFSWRNQDVPVIYYARESWFIKTTALAERMVELNKTINWQPPEVGSGSHQNSVIAIDGRCPVG